MEIRIVDPSDALWARVADYAEACPWRAGASLAQEMRQGVFTDWERVFAALDGETVAGYCTFAKTDCLPDVPYTPFIGYVFVDEAYRGHRLSQRMLQRAMAYAKGLGFQKVYLVSDHEGLYEKYGFTKADARPAPWDASKVETVFVHGL